MWYMQAAVHTVSCRGDQPDMDYLTNVSECATLPPLQCCSAWGNQCAELHLAELGYLPLRDKLASGLPYDHPLAVKRQTCTAHGFSVNGVGLNVYGRRLGSASARLFHSAAVQQ